MDMENIVTTEQLVYRYQAQPADNATEPLLQAALDGIDIHIAKGEFVAVLGHNGSGKSTLAKQINALLTPTEGIVWVNGISTADGERVWDIRSRVGMVFQNPDNQLIATVVEDDVAFGPENLGVPPDEIRRRVDVALRMVGMTAFAANPPHFLSGGQKQRVAIAGILAMRPDVIVLDEPTAMLDPIGRREVMNVVKQLNQQENITIIFITHFMDEAAQADRVIVMEAGKVVMNDRPDKVFSQIEVLKKIGLDVPHSTEIADKLRRAGLAMPENIITIHDLVEAICQLK